MGELVASTLKDLSRETLPIRIVNKNDKQRNMAKSITKDFKDLLFCIPDDFRAAKFTQHAY